MRFQDCELKSVRSEFIGRLIHIGTVNPIVTLSSNRSVGLISISNFKMHEVIVHKSMVFFLKDLRHFADNELF